MIPSDIIKRVPKVELHHHLDGGLRPSTVIELSNKQGIKLPADNEKDLKDWFEKGCRLKSLTLYLQTFSVTTAIMQDEESLARIAYETVLDWHAENVVYGEVRFAPIFHTAKGLSMARVVEAVLRGMEQGKKETGVCYGVILCAMRHQSPEISLEVAKLAVAFRDRGVVGFDLAGDESGNPPKKHIEAFQYIRKKNFNITLHAGEAFGLDSIWQAIQVCGAHRIGHGTRLVEDVNYEGLRIESMGDLAHYVLDKRIPLEMCLSSNIGTGAAPSFAEHPFQLFFRNHFRVFLCTDNPLMSDTTMTKEMQIAADNYGLTLKDLERISVNAMKSSFIHHDEKLTLIYQVIKKQFADIRQEYGYSDWN
ncbi:MAG: adenosine deaminase [Sphaerochaetaceae bacterium]|nr:adenosine deaminase [Sphaerochaetaceae bacterium]